MAFVALVFVGAFAAFEYSKSRHHVVKVLVSTARLRSVEIGAFDNSGSGDIAAIAEISRQIKLHPHTEQFEAHYLNNGNLDFYWSQNVYKRATKKLLWITKEAPHNIVPPPRWSFVSHFPFFRKFTLISRPYSCYIFDERRPVVYDDDIHIAAENGWSLYEITNAAKQFHKPQAEIGK